MSDTQRARIQSLLAAEASPLRDELVSMVFGALVAQPVSVVASHPDLVDLILRGMQPGSVETLTRRHVLPAVARVQRQLAGSDVTVRGLLSKDAQDSLQALVAGGKGPRFAWLKGAVDPGDVQKLITPIVQQVLTSFVAKLPIPGMSGSSRSDPPPAPRAGMAGGLVGMIGKQVAKGASQLAGGLGLQQVVRDFSQSATTEVRLAIVDRMKSAEGREITLRIRDRVLERILGTEARTIVDDFLRVPPADVARIARGALSHTRDLPLFRAIVAGEIHATLTEVGTQPIHDALDEMGLLEPARSVALATAHRAVAELVRTDAFGSWVDRILAESAK